MVEKHPTPKSAGLFDRSDKKKTAKRAMNLPWTTEKKRGALNLEKDRAQHRRCASLYEDLLN